MEPKAIKRSLNDGLQYVMESQLILRDLSVPDRESKHVDNLLCYSNKHGALIIGNGNRLQSILYSRIEQGIIGADDDETLKPEHLISELQCPQDILSIKLSCSEKFLSVYCEAVVLVYEIGDLLEKNEPILRVSLTESADNFSQSWLVNANKEDLLGILNGGKITLLNPISLKTDVHPSMEITAFAQPKELPNAIILASNGNILAIKSISDWKSLFEISLSSIVPSDHAIHFLSCHPNGLLAVGSKAMSNEDNASFRLLQIDWSSSHAVQGVFASRAAICSSDYSNYKYHHFYTRDITERNQLLVGSNLSAECWVLNLEYESNGKTLAKVTIDEPGDEKGLSITDEEEYEPSVNLGMELSLNSSAPLLFGDGELAPTPVAILLAQCKQLVCYRMADAEQPPHEVVPAAAIPACSVKTRGKTLNFSELNDSSSSSQSSSGFSFGTNNPSSSGASQPSGGFSFGSTSANSGFSFGAASAGTTSGGFGFTAPSTAAPAAKKDDKAYEKQASALMKQLKLTEEDCDLEDMVDSIKDAEKAWSKVVGEKEEYEIKDGGSGGQALKDGEDDDPNLEQLLTELGTTYSAEEHGVQLRAASKKVGSKSVLSRSQFVDWYINWLYKVEDEDLDDEEEDEEEVKNPAASSGGWSNVTWKVAPTAEGAWKCQVCSVSNPKDAKQCLACETKNPNYVEDPSKKEEKKDSAPPKFTFGVSSSAVPAEPSKFTFGTTAPATSGGSSGFSFRVPPNVTTTAAPAPAFTGGFTFGTTSASFGFGTAPPTATANKKDDKAYEKQAKALMKQLKLTEEDCDLEDLVDSIKDAEKAWSKVVGEKEEYEIKDGGIGGQALKDGEDDDPNLEQLLTELGTTYSAEEHGVELRAASKKVGSKSLLSRSQFVDWYINWLYKVEDEDLDDEEEDEEEVKNSAASSGGWSNVTWKVAPTAEGAWKCQVCSVSNPKDAKQCLACETKNPNYVEDPSKKTEEKKDSAPPKFTFGVSSNTSVPPEMKKTVSWTTNASSKDLTSPISYSDIYKDVASPHIATPKFAFGGGSETSSQQGDAVSLSDIYKDVASPHIATPKFSFGLEPVREVPTPPLTSFASTASDHPVIYMTAQLHSVKQLLQAFDDQEMKHEASINRLVTQAKIAREQYEAVEDENIEVRFLHQQAENYLLEMNRLLVQIKDYQELDKRYQTAFSENSEHFQLFNQCPTPYDILLDRDKSKLQSRLQNLLSELGNLTKKQQRLAKVDFQSRQELLQGVTASYEDLNRIKSVISKIEDKIAPSTTTSFEGQSAVPESRFNEDRPLQTGTISKLSWKKEAQRLKASVKYEAVVAQHNKDKKAKPDPRTVEKKPVEEHKTKKFTWQAYRTKSKAETEKSKLKEAAKHPPTQAVNVSLTGNPFAATSKNESKTAAPVAPAVVKKEPAKDQKAAASQPPIPTAAPSAFSFGGSGGPQQKGSDQPPVPAKAPTAFGAKPAEEAKATKAAWQPPIAETAPSTFSFGTTTKKEEPKAAAAGQPPIASAAPSTFSFGSTGLKKEVASKAAGQPPIAAAAPSTFSLGATTTTKKEETAKDSKAASQPPIPSAAPSTFSFGTTAAKKEDTKAAGQPPIAAAAPSAFSFGTTTTTKKEEPSKDSKAASQPPIPSAAPSTFSFGTTTAKDPKATAAAGQPPIAATAPSTFSFGTTTKKEEPKENKPAAAAAGQPPIPAAAPSAFSFGSTTTTKKEEPLKDSSKVAAGQPPIPAAAPSTFSFGGAKKEEAKDSKAAGQPPIPAAAPSTFSFGTTTTTAKKDDSKENKPAAAAASQPPIPSAAPSTFSFGTTATTKKEEPKDTKTTAAGQPPIAAAAPSTFSFGVATKEEPKGETKPAASAGQPPIPSAAPSTFSFAATTSKEEPKETKTGAGQQPIAATAPSTFSFGGANKKEESKETKPAAAAAAGQPPVPAAAPSTFSFGAAATSKKEEAKDAKASSTGAGQPPIPSAAPSTFSFGAATKKEESKDSSKAAAAAGQPTIAAAAPSTFSFGGAKKEEPKTATAASVASQPPIPAAAPSTFSFGTAATKKEEPKDSKAAASQPPVSAAAPITFSFGSKTDDASGSLFSSTAGSFLERKNSMMGENANKDTAAPPPFSQAATSSLFKKPEAAASPQAASPATSSGSSLFGGNKGSSSFGGGFAMANSGANNNSNESKNIFAKPSNPLFTAQPGAFGSKPAAATTITTAPGSGSFSLNSFGAALETPATQPAAPTTSLFGGSLPNNNNNNITSTASATGFGGGFGQQSSIGTNNNLNAIQKRVEDIYKQYNPSKIDEIPRIMEKYRGRETELVASLEKKYMGSSSAVPPPAASSGLSFGGAPSTSTGFGTTTAPNTSGIFNFGNAGSSSTTTSSLFANSSSGFGQSASLGFGQSAQPAATSGGGGGGFGSGSGFGGGGFGAAPAGGSGGNMPAFGAASSFGNSAGNTNSGNPNMSFSAFANNNKGNSTFGGGNK